MTPLQLAKQHCANYQDGQCMGMDFDVKGNHFAFRKRGPCWLGDPIQRCTYAETAVLPQNVADWPATDAQSFVEGVQAYKKATGEVIPKHASAKASDERICPQCKIRILEPRQRFCYICAEAREKAAQRERQRKTRGLSS
jgi:hypothetical protein